VPNLDFYATAEDLKSVLDVVFDQPSWRLTEFASRDDQPLRWFSSTTAVLDAFDFGATSAHLGLYAPSMRGKIVERAIVYRPGAVPGALGRTDTQGWGLIQLYLVGTDDGSLRPSHTNHNTRKRAAKWASISPELGDIDAWDWVEVERMSRRLNHQIRRLAVTKSGSRPILSGAAAAVAAGSTLAAV